MFRIGVVILNFISYKETIDCVNCFLNQKKDDNEIKIVIVDNGSNNNSFTEIKQTFINNTDVFVERLPKNVGYAKGNNFGYKKICEKFNQIPDFVIISNSDIVLVDNQLYSWIFKEKEKCDFAILGPDIFSLRDKTHQSPFYVADNTYLLEEKINSRNRKDYKYGFEHLISDVRPNHKYLSYSKRHILHGSFLVFSKLYFDYYNEPFYPETFLYYEEAILKLRCNLKSLIMLYSPEYRVNHLQSVSALSIFKNKEEYHKKTEKQLNDSLQIYYRLLKKTEKMSLKKRIKSITKKCFDSLPWIRGVNKKILDNRRDIENVFDLFSNKLVFEYVPTESVNRLAVYTAIIGNNDNLINLSNVSNNCDYYCITDNKKITSNLWKIIYFNPQEHEELIGLDNEKITCFIKTHPNLFFQNYKHTIWIDSNTDIIGEIASWILIHNKSNSLVLFRNFQSDLLSEEADKCISLENDKNNIINDQVSKYYREGYDESIPLVKTNIIYRENNTPVNEINSKWWNEIKKYSSNDQLSLNYVLWGKDIKFDLCDLNPFDNRYFKKPANNQ